VIRALVSSRLLPNTLDVWLYASSRIFVVCVCICFCSLGLVLPGFRGCCNLSCYFCLFVCLILDFIGVLSSHMLAREIFLYTDEASKSTNSLSSSI
jgi:hypothetical protein